MNGWSISVHLVAKNKNYSLPHMSWGRITKRKTLQELKPKDHHHNHNNNNDANEDEDDGQC